MSTRIPQGMGRLRLWSRYESCWRSRRSICRGRTFCRIRTRSSMRARCGRTRGRRLLCAICHSAAEKGVRDSREYVFENSNSVHRKRDPITHSHLSLPQSTSPSSKKLIALFVVVSSDHGRVADHVRCGPFGTSRYFVKPTRRLPRTSSVAGVYVFFGTGWAGVSSIVGL